MTNVHTSGALQSPADYRNKIAASAVPIIPSSLASYTYPNTALYPVLMQNFIPACVAHSLATLVTDYFYKKTGKVISFSPRWIDALMKTVDGQDLATGGAFPQVGLKMLRKYGCATTATVPNDTTLPVLEYRNIACLTPQAYAEAAEYKIPGYIAIELTTDAIRNAIAQFGLVSILRSIGVEWYTALNGVESWKDSDIDPLRTPAVVIGGHQTEDFAWNEANNELRNEWSTAWANGGNAAYNIEAWLPFTKEAWVIAEVPAETAAFLAELPQLGEFHYNWTVDMSYGQGPTDDIKYLQIALMILGFMQQPPVDQLGVYGPKTSAAVLVFQHAHNVPDEGLEGKNSGPLTRAALNSVFN